MQEITSKYAPLIKQALWSISYDARLNIGRDFEIIDILNNVSLRIKIIKTNVSSINE